MPIRNGNAAGRDGGRCIGSWADAASVTLASIARRASWISAAVDPSSSTRLSAALCGQRRT
jgi:hypothetical protein